MGKGRGRGLRRTWKNRKERKRSGPAATATGRRGDGRELGERIDLVLGFRKLKTLKSGLGLGVVGLPR